MSTRSSTNSLLRAENFGIHEGCINRAKGAELLRFITSKSGDEQACLKVYIDRVKEGQNDMYHNTGDCIAVVSSSPFYAR